MSAELTIRVPPDAPSWWRQTAEALLTHLEERPSIVSAYARDVGSNTSKVRFVASRACHSVTVHVQSDKAGEGGADYDPSNFASETRVDTYKGEDKQQDVSISRDGTNHFWVWLIPEIKIPPRGGTARQYDTGGPEDRMAFLDLGT